MKRLFVLILFTFGLTFTGFSQTNTYYQNKNIISWDEFTDISFNEITLGSIMDTKGDPAKVNALFGVTMKVEKSDDPNYYWISFHNSDITFSFDELVTSPAALSSLDVENNTVAVKIGNKIIHIGDSIDKLGNVKILANTDGSKSILFLSEPADDQWVSVDFNQSTKIITKISYTTI